MHSNVQLFYLLLFFVVAAALGEYKRPYSLRDANDKQSSYLWENLIKQ